MSKKISYHDIPDPRCAVLKEQHVENGFIATLQNLMIVRSYQVYAVKHMVTCIDDDNGNGYIWHTTGSCKTLNSFKSFTLLKESTHIRHLALVA